LETISRPLPLPTPVLFLRPNRTEDFKGGLRETVNSLGRTIRCWEGFGAN